MKKTPCGASLGRGWLSLGDKLCEQEEGLVGVGGGVAADSVEDETDDGVGEDGDNEADDGIKNGVFGVGDFLAVTAGDDVADATPD